MVSEEKFFLSELQKVGIELPGANLEKLFAFLKMLLTANQTTNLTAIKDYQEALIKHLFDSLVIFNHPVFQNAQTILDVGSGAGIPAIPLAICAPQKQVNSLDSTRKKIEFQETVRQELQLANLFPLWGRAEELGKSAVHREQYDLVIARAVSATNSLVELTIPFLKLNSHALYYKGKDYQQEIKDAEKALQILNTTLESIIKTSLPSGQGERAVIIVKKIKNTPAKYPRANGAPQKHPL